MSDHASVTPPEMAGPPLVPVPPDVQPRPPRRWWRWVGRAIVAVVVLAALAVLWAYVQLRSSLPPVEGALTVPGLTSAVLVSRDRLGVPTIQGQSRADVSRALGVVHAHDRFFQMDLARRRAAGELAELLGPPALPVDRAARFHRFRARARIAIDQATAEERTLLDAYSEGVNAGLGSLGAVPFEYSVLRQSPRPWRPEDSMLVLATMFFNLQDEKADTERRAGVLRELFPGALADFLDSTASQWDTPLEGPQEPAPVPPEAGVFDWRSVARAIGPPGSAVGAADAAPAWPSELAAFQTPSTEATPGSNNWAVAGSRAAAGRAIVANDMHLAIGLPNTWFRATLMWYGSDGAQSVTGVTLPGLPAVVAGSNGHVAWGFTNTAGDWSDRVLVEPAEGDPSSYKLSGGTKPFVTFNEQIAVKGGADQGLDVRETVWGPVMPPDAGGRQYAIAWVPQQPGGMNLHLMALESARTLDAALEIANTAGIPAQNMVIGDATGRIAWTVAGRIPRRVGFDGRLSESWADGTRGWSGWYEPAEYPRVVDPPDGLLVTANNRLIDGSGLAMVGNGDFDPGARARQIRRALEALSRPTVADMLTIHLDDRAELMSRWRALLLDTLTEQAASGHPDRVEFRRLVAEGWTGRAAIDSVSYRLVRQFRTTAAELTFGPFVERARTIDPEFPTTPGRALEGPAWALLTLKPLHLLNPRYADWTALILDAVDRSIATLTANGGRLGDRTWGEVNTLRVRHVLANGLPLLGRWLELPQVALPGDAHVPRVQGTAFGASERFAVSPGEESAGYFHMPGGQSGHPLSPHFDDGQEAWITGEATSFLPGPPVSKLTLVPGGR